MKDRHQVSKSGVESAPRGTRQDVESWAELREQCREAIERRDLDDAKRWIARAEDFAKQCGDEELADRARCNRSMVRMADGDFDGAASTLLEILTRNGGNPSGFAAAYNLSWFHDLQSSPKKALFYAQIGRDIALGLRQEGLLAKAFAQIGRCLAMESFFKEAAEEYERALSLLPERNAIRVAVEANLAYPRLLLGQDREAFTSLQQSLGWYRARGQWFNQVWPHLVLSFGYNRHSEPRKAWHHGRLALEIAEHTENPTAIKSALYLMGNASKRVGDVETAQNLFRRLQREHAPECKGLAQALLDFDTEELINLGC